MKIKLNIFIMAVLALTTVGCTSKEDKSPIRKPEITIPEGRMTPEALWAMGRIGSVAPDPETGWLAYTVTYCSVEENRSTTWIRICVEEQAEDKSDANKKEPNLKVIDEFVGSDPAWFGNSGVLAYLKGGKLYLRQDGKDIEVSGYDKDIEGFLLSPARDQIILISQVKTIEKTVDKYPDLPKASGRIVTDLMYKHWDEWTESAPQPFVAPLDIKYKGEMAIRKAKIGDAVNILEGTAYESPMKPFGGIEQLDWSKDGKTVAYTCRKKVGIEYALSTNSDIYLYDTETHMHKNITEENKGYDTNPSYSPNGEWIAWQSMERDGYESDENRLMVMNLNTGERRWLSKGLDTNVDSYYWQDDSTIVFNAVWHATEMLYTVNLNGERECLTEGQYDYEPVGTIGEKVYCLRHSMREANEIYSFIPGGNMHQLTHENDNIYNQITLSDVEPRWQKTTDGKDMLTWIIYPPHYDPEKKYPTLLYCEGGPQSPVSQFWSYRWNFMMMASNGYIVVAPNRRGLPGFGKKWNEEISGDYGGQCMKDYFSAIDEAAKNIPSVDKDHMGCVGASFGGFSVYWIAGHHDKRFKAFIAHDGIFNMEMQYLETEEKWFANWDMGGAYWDKKNWIAQRTFQNSPHKFVDKWDTPILCIHGEKDYRILANQAMAAYDAAKMRGIPAELLVFPDENHWVLQPQNGILWQREFAGWLDKWLKN